MSSGSQRRGWLALVAVMVVSATVFWVLRDSPRDTRGDHSDTAGEASAPKGFLGAPTELNLHATNVGARRSSPHSVLVSGRVLEQANGRPVPKIDVAFSAETAEFVTTSDDSGQYSLDLAPATYEVRAAGDGVIAPAPPRLVVSPNTPPIRYDVGVVRLARVRGEVLDAEGPVAGVDVFVRSDSPKAEVYVQFGELVPVLSEPNGQFELPVPPGSVELQATDGRRHGFVRIDELGPGEVRAGVNISLNDNVVLRGSVVDSTGLPVPNLEVHCAVHFPRSKRQADTHFVTTGRKGDFELTVRPGVTRLEARKSGQGPAVRVLTTMPGERQNVALALTRPLRVSGRVVDTKGAPVEGVRVRMGPHGSKLPPTYVFSDAKGNFEFTELDPGPQLLIATREGFQRVDREITDHATGVVTVELTAE